MKFANEQFMNFKIKSVNKNETDKIDNLFKFEDKPWCRVNDITKILDYKNGRDALMKHVAKNTKSRLLIWVSQNAIPL
jgi:prophage antirepressor-like protein